MRIPTNPKYDIDSNGIVRLISTGEVVPEYRNHRGKRAVKIRGKSHKPSSHPLDRLMLNTYKPPVNDYNHEWLSIRHVDGNKDNISIDNLEWDERWYHPPFVPGLHVQKDIWIPVYGYPSLEFKFALDTILFRHSFSFREIGTREDEGGYLCVSIPNTGRQEKIHRLIALTLLPHPLDTDHLVVNHRDSNIKNNNPYNLEWSTYSHNNFHAYSEGPRSKTVRKIRLKNVETGEETVVAGIQEMSRHLDILPQAAHQALVRRTSKGKPYKGYVFKYDDDPRNWTELISGEDENNKIPPFVACKDMTTGDVTIHDSLRSLKRHCGVRDFMVRRLLKQKYMVPWRGYCFQEYVPNKQLQWPDYPRELIDVYSRTHASDKPIIVTYPDGYYQMYTGVTEWCMEDRIRRCDPAVLSRFLKKSKGHLKWRDWSFEYVDLSKYPVV